MAINNTTLKQELLSSLARGIASTKILPVTKGSVTMSAIDFTSAGLIYSIEGTFDLDWSEPSIDEIKVDQGQQTIAIDIDKGDITFSANYPTVATAALDEFFEVGKAVTVTTGANESYSGKSYMLTPKTTEVSMLVEDQDKKYAITFARVSITARLAYDSDTKMWYIGLNGRVLTNLADGEGDVSIAVKSA